MPLFHFFMERAMAFIQYFDKNTKKRASKQFVFEDYHAKPSDEKKSKSGKLKGFIELPNTKNSGLGLLLCS